LGYGLFILGGIIINKAELEKRIEELGAQMESILVERKKLSRRIRASKKNIAELDLKAGELSKEILSLINRLVKD
jgi:peptidoglycan hydrolase CwlO-like protein